MELKSELITTLEERVDNVLSFAFKTDPGASSAGEAAYVAAYNLVELLAKEHGLSGEQIHKIFFALSLL